MREFTRSRATELLSSSLILGSSASVCGSLKEDLLRDLVRQLELVYAPYFHLISSASASLNQLPYNIESFSPPKFLSEREKDAFRLWQAELATIFDHSNIYCTELKEALGNSEITGLSPPLGDVHNGSAVRKITFGLGQTAYFKPRSVKPEIAWYSFVNELARYFPCLRGSAVEIIAGDEAGGWMVNCEHRELKERENASQFYYAAGVLGFWLWVLGAKDMVFSNFVANGEYPCLIDAETVSYPTFLSAKAYVQTESVLQTGYLPRSLYVRGTDGVCTSGLLPYGQLTTQLNEFRETDDGSIEFCRRNIEVNDPSCMPSHQGTRYGVLHFKDEVVRGFRAPLQQLSAEDFADLSRVAQREFESVNPRLAVRSTIFYRELLDQLSFQMHGDGASAAKHLLQTTAIKRGFSCLQENWFVERELENLSIGSVPRFEFNPRKNQVLSCGKRIDCTMYVNALRMMEIINLISEIELERQVEEILSSLETFETRQLHSSSD